MQSLHRSKLGHPVEGLRVAADGAAAVAKPRRCRPNIRSAAGEPSRLATVPFRQIVPAAVPQSVTTRFRPVKCADSVAELGRDHDDFGDRRDVSFHHVAASRAAVRQREHRVRVHVRLAVAQRNVADQ